MHETCILLRYHTRVSMAINGASNGQHAEATRPSAASAIVANSTSITILSHLLRSLLYYARVSTAINGANNGHIAVPTRPHAATAIAPSSNNSNISFHLLFVR